MFVYLSRIEGPPPKRNADGSIPPTNATKQSCSPQDCFLLTKHFCICAIKRFGNKKECDSIKTAQGQVAHRQDARKHLPTSAFRPRTQKIQRGRAAGRVLFVSKDLLQIMFI